MSNMTPERESALDHLLDPELWLPAGFRGENVDYAECPPRERVERARAEAAALRDELQDWRDGARRAAAEDCPTDEKHCTCVAALRARVRELELAMRVKPPADKRKHMSWLDPLWTQGYVDGRAGWAKALRDQGFQIEGEP